MNTDDLVFRNVGTDDLNEKELRKLYRRSFPLPERIPFPMLKKSLNENGRMCALYEKDKLIGMYHIFMEKDIVYLAYICITEKERGKGYGAFLLKHIRDSLPGYRITVDIEEAKEKDRNYEEESFRKAFYLRNGYEETRVFYRIFGVCYEVLSDGGRISTDEWEVIALKYFLHSRDLKIWEG